MTARFQPTYGCSQDFTVEKLEDCLGVGVGVGVGVGDGEPESGIEIQSPIDAITGFECRSSIALSVNRCAAARFGATICADNCRIFGVKG